MTACGTDNEKHLPVGQYLCSLWPCHLNFPVLFTTGLHLLNLSRRLSFEVGDTVDIIVSLKIFLETLAQSGRVISVFASGIAC